MIIFLPAMPLRSYHASLPAEGRIDYETLEQLAREGKLAGTYKQGRNWWINLMAHTRLGTGMADEQGIGTDEVIQASRQNESRPAAAQELTTGLDPKQVARRTAGRSMRIPGGN